MNRNCLIVNIKTGTREEYRYLGEDKNSYYYKELGRGNKKTLVLDKLSQVKKIFIEN